MMRACTRLRMSVIARCAATPRICDRMKDVTAWTSVAAPAASAIGTSRSVRPFPTTSSSRYFGANGRIMPAIRLMSMSARPSESRRRCTQIRSRASRMAAEAVTFFFLAGSSATRAAAVLRPTFSPVPRPPRPI
jgi:hypothetical protein